MRLCTDPTFPYSLHAVPGLARLPTAARRSVRAVHRVGTVRHTVQVKKGDGSLFQRAAPLPGHTRGRRVDSMPNRFDSLDAADPPAAPKKDSRPLFLLTTQLPSRPLTK